MHGRIRLGQQFSRGVGLFRIKADADAGGCKEILIVQAIRFSQMIQYALGELLRGLRRAIFQQDDEFIAAATRQRVVGAYMALQAAGDFAQQLIALGMPQGFID